jgi:hypothetical protein
MLPCSTAGTLEPELIKSWEELFDSLWVKADQDLCTDHKGWRYLTVIGSHQLEDRRLVRADILFGELNSSSLEDRLNGKAGRSTGLGEEYHLLGFGHEFLSCRFTCMGSTHCKNGLSRAPAGWKNSLTEVTENP